MQRILNTGNEIALQLPFNRVPRNSFNMTHEAMLSGNIGELLPCCRLECLPGDVFHIQSFGFMRLQPMIFPELTQMKIRTEFFFVPYRLLWANFEELISPQFPGSTPPAMPFLMPDTAVTQGTRGD